MDERFKDAKLLLEARLSRMPYVPTMPHLPWTFFPNGVFKFVDPKSNREKGQSGGSFGGMRSSWFPVILFQLYFAIGYDGKVLPVSDTFEYSPIGNRNHKILLGNLTKIVQTTILSLLDLNFSLCRTEFSQSDLVDIQKIASYANNQFENLHRLKSAVLFDMKKLMMRKNHMLHHVGELIHLFGAVSQFNTESFESAHREYTVGVWEQTSKRHISRNVEMMVGSMTRAHSEHINFKLSMKTLHDKVKYLRMHGPNSYPENIEFSRVGGTKSFILKSENVKRLQFVDARNTEKIIHPQFSLDLLADFIFTELCNSEKSKWIKYITGCNGVPCTLNLSLLLGITYTGTKESDLGSGQIYANPLYGSSKKARYDFVIIPRENEGITSEDLAQIINIFQVHNSEDKTTTMYGVCLFLREVPDNNRCQKTLGIRVPFKEYQFNNQIDARQHERQIICLNDTLNRPAMVIPIFQKMTTYEYCHGRPSKYDRFFLVEWKYVDRSRWNSLMEESISERLECRTDSAVYSTDDAINNLHAGVGDYEEIERNIVMDGDEYERF